ncbi:TonB-linked outer membrane protein, SusC/RagA family [Chitinophaga jiangningensis]|uniref:TonB-linked outer membrane protein, SusC/RagA family n=1 Tax=Chitinophaga jiangningensis TaxID=1419482 RepID=A0A1M7BWI6_9BACT|nr:SusC/RagA family TonB-linked outer membrane protein [Chitinophaga jiangningensis]SHL59398.1 TonB-linked outer membrane protein, SusC/RagA family [Chitinophaga jiangningensis]
MKRKYISILSLSLLAGWSNVHAQTTPSDSVKVLQTGSNKMVDLGMRSEKQWRTTAATYSITGDDLARTSAANLLNALQGRIPGLTVVTGSGEPGYDNPGLYIRGTSSWNLGANRLAIYLDGFPVDLGALSPLSAFEIESVTVLKDAAATAIYGLQGGTGVLSVRTKKGNQSERIQITANGRYSVGTPIQLPQVMNAYDYTRLYNQALANDGLPSKYPNPDLYKATNDPVHPNVNWYDEVLRKISVLQDYNLTFRGGSEKARYFVLMGYTDYAGIYKNADAIDVDYGTNAKYKRINLRANVDLQLSKNLSVGVNLSGITEDRITPNGFSASTVFNNLSRIPAAAFPVKNPDNTWGTNGVYGFNPVQLLQQSGSYNSHARNLQTALNITERLDQFVPGLSLTGLISFNNQYIGTYQKIFTVKSAELLKDVNDQAILDSKGNYTYKTFGAISQSISDGGNQHWQHNTVQVGLNYNRNFGAHTFSGAVQGRRENYTHEGQVYAVRTQGLFSYLTYDYNGKYIVDFSGSYSGAADFAPGSQYGFFPAVGAGWILSNEPFLQNQQVVNFLKLRASYGKTGSINEDNRFLFEKWAVGGNGWYTGADAGSNQAGRLEGANPNTAFTWEAKTAVNFGMEAQLLNKLSFTADVFHEKRTGILQAPATVPSFTGFRFQRLNTGVVENKGFEAALTWKDKVNAFEYYAGVNGAFARNKIISMAQDAQPAAYLYNQGYRINQMRGLQWAGFYQQSDFDANGVLKEGVVKTSYTVPKPGDLKYVDQDGNGVVNDYDIVPMKYAKLPEISLGLNLGFKYKGFDVDAFVQAVMNRTVSLLDDAYDYTHPFVNNNNITKFSNNAWTPETATTATSPRLSTLNNVNNNVNSDFWMRNGNFLKLRSVELGYTFPKKGFLKKMNTLRVFLIGNNLFTIDKLDDMEAERLSMGYPLMKSYSFGLNARF